jgi:hypothetical protein
MAQVEERVNIELLLQRLKKTIYGQSCPDFFFRLSYDYIAACITKSVHCSVFPPSPRINALAYLVVNQNTIRIFKDFS